MHKEHDAEASTISAAIRKDESRLLVIASTLKSLYEDKASGELSKEMFQTFMRDYTQEQTEIEDRLPRLRRELDIIKETTGEIDERLSLVENCVNLEMLDRATATGLIEKITVSERVKANGKQTQELSITYQFIGNLLQNAKEDIASQAMPSLV